MYRNVQILSVLRYPQSLCVSLFKNRANKMSHVMKKKMFFFCNCEYKAADQLLGNREADPDQRLCFDCTYSTISLLPKSEISSLWPSSVAVQPGLCRTRSLTRMLVFSFMMLLICYLVSTTETEKAES